MVATIAMIDRFTTKYRGRRYSFGYPACPALKDQAGIWKVLRPEEIGVQLTEGFMMDPEPSDEGSRETTLSRFNAHRVLRAGASNINRESDASVSALVCHHPDCTYFGVGETTE
jgi:cobalamin-dependent methionine synthase I